MALKTFSGKSAQAIATEIMSMRAGAPSQGKAPRRIYFGEFCRTVLKADPGKVLHELGVNLSTMTVDLLLSSDHDARYLIGEFFLEPVVTGYMADPWWTELMAGDVTCPNNQVNAPNFDATSVAGPEATGEAETVSGDTLTSATRTVELRKLARMLEISYEAMMFSTIEQVAIWLKIFGAKMAQTMNSRAVDRLVNGDQANGSMAPATIGINSVADGFVWKDFLRVCIRMAMLGYPISSMVCGDEDMIDVMSIEQFQKLQQGQPLTTVNLKTPIPKSLDSFPHSGVGDGKLLFVAKGYAAHSATCKPMTIETDKIIAKQVEQTLAWCIQDVVNLMRYARVIVDTNVAFATAGWPDAMAVE